jgi:hypothetical protein
MVAILGWLARKSRIFCASHNRSKPEQKQQFMKWARHSGSSVFSRIAPWRCVLRRRSMIGSTGVAVMTAARQVVLAGPDYPLRISCKPTTVIER